MHGEGGPKNAPLTVSNTSSGSNQQPAVPRAVLAVDLNAVNPVSVKAPTVLGEDDPYKSIKAKIDSGTTAPADGKAAPIENTDTNSGQSSNQGPEVRRAEPVRPLDEPAPTDTTIKVDAPPALDF